MMQDHWRKSRIQFKIPLNVHKKTQRNIRFFFQEHTTQPAVAGAKGEWVTIIRNKYKLEDI